MSAFIPLLLMLVEPLPGAVEPSTAMTPEVVTPSREQDAQHTGDESARDIDDAAIGAPPGAPIQAVQPLGDPFPTGIPLDWLGEAADNLRFSVDVAGRAQYNRPQPTVVDGAVLRLRSVQGVQR